jgi:hypothetical protein
MKPMKSFTPTYGRAGALFAAARSGQFESCPLKDAVIIPEINEFLRDAIVNGTRVKSDLIRVRNLRERRSLWIRTNLACSQ